MQARENEEKNNRTPYEAFSTDPRWNDILGRVRRFNGPFAAAKLAAFRMDEEAVRERYDNFTGAIWRIRGLQRERHGGT